VINWLTGEINARNGLLDEAIQSFESVLATRIPSRKIDLSLDYEVINELALAFYGRARIEAIQSPERQELLKKTIATYRRTLAIDSENDVAHYGLGLAFGDPAWGIKTGAKPPPAANAAPNGNAEATTPESLLSLAAAAADVKASALKRRAAAQRLAQEIVRFMEGARPRYQSRLEPLHDVAEILGRAWDAGSDAGTQSALARALEVTHKRLHERLKPDETAEGRAFRLARERDPAANQNAQSIVIHSLHRRGAPLFDTPTSQPARAAFTETRSEQTIAASSAARSTEKPE
jgi:hypothetical protein